VRLAGYLQASGLSIAILSAAGLVANAFAKDSIVIHPLAAIILLVAGITFALMGHANR
jgi:hypothetical protein